MSDIITITEADLARLQSWEFEEVWRAVGYVFRRRAEASKTLSAVPPAIEPAPVPLAPVEAPPVVPPGRAPGEKEGADYSPEIPDAGQPGDAVEECRSDTNIHVHRYKLGSPAGDSVEGLCECGHRKLHPADLNGDISRNGKRSPNPKCPHCGKHALRDRHGYWCNGCQLEGLAS